MAVAASIATDETDGIAYAKWEEEKARENCQAQAEKETSQESTQEEVGPCGHGQSLFAIANFLRRSTTGKRR
ncbi:MAG: hypothetical protein WEA36_01665 [Balneolaceae bacterium]